MMLKLPTLRDEYKVASALCVLTIIAIYLRFKNLTFQSLWNDELASAFLSDPDRSILSVFNFTLRHNHPPLYQAWLWLWYRWFGFNEYSGRALSAIVGSLAVPAMYFLGKEFFCKRVGVYSALIATFNYFLVFYSQETRSYILLFLFTCLSWYYCMKCIHDRTAGRPVMYCLTTILLLYTHYYGFLVFTAQIVCALRYAFSTNRILMKQFLPYMAIISLAALPLFPTMSWMAAKTDFWLEQPDPWFIVDYFHDYFDSDFLSILFGLILLLGLKFKGDGFVKKYRTEMQCNAIWLFIVYFLPYLRGFISLPMLHVRYTIVCLPAIIMLLALSINEIESRFRRNALVVLVLIGSAVALFYPASYYTTINKEQHRQAIETLLDRRKHQPVYSCNSKWVNTYLKMLGSSLRTQSHELIMPVLEEGKINGEMWIITNSIHGCEELVTLIDKQIKKSVVTAIEKTGFLKVKLYHLSAPPPDS